MKLAIGDNNRLKASDIEFKLTQPSYTVVTLAYLKEKYSDHEFVLIMGADNLKSFHKWKNYEAILRHHLLYVYPRPDNPTSIFDNHPQVKRVNAPLMQISSTEIRKAIHDKKDVRYYMPEAVWNYIKEMHFYEK